MDAFSLNPSSISKYLRIEQLISITLPSSKNIEMVRKLKEVIWNITMTVSRVDSLHTQISEYLRKHRHHYPQFQKIAKVGPCYYIYEVTEDFRRNRSKELIRRV